MSSYRKNVIKLFTFIVAMLIILVLLWDSSVLSTKSPFYGLARSHFENYSSKAVNEDRKTFFPNNASGLKAYLSPFYGINHQHSYGLARSHFKNYLSKITKNKDWKTFFPITVSALKTLLIKNPSMKSGFYTKSFSVSLDKNNYYFGDEFTATIRSRDSTGNQKTFGGDYYRARLIRDNSSYPDGIPCRVIDNEDGSYTVKAPLVLNGRLTLEAVLVISIEGIHEILEQTKDKPLWGYLFTALLESGEKVLCSTNLSQAIEAQDKPLCDYSNPRNDEPWFCVKPTSNYCSKILSLKYSNGMESVVNFAKICFTYGCYKTNQNQTIEVQLLEQNTSMMDQLEFGLPSCQNEFATTRTEKPFTGYFSNGTWKTLVCKNLYGSIQQTKSCFKNKIVYFIGDSTIRQFFYLFSQTLELNVSRSKHTTIWQQPRVAYEDPRWLYNTTMYYRAHGPPLLNPGPPNTRPYISDLVTDLPVGGDNVYVIFNIGAHLFHYDPNMYIHRLNGIRHAILRHHEQFPDTKFIVRGLNVMEFLYEWNIFRFEEILFETFRSLRNVVYLNLWDLTTVWPLDDYHPRDCVLHQQALFMTQYICS